ncbi:TetR family transcriptional regulator C-terminal domain-containing protein [Streptomyces sp. 8N706]|uniref:TetR family transcriptional regulator C-terminal domain-containing protein n=1 Tax=Streptomyces sp. 8N706 TaxID=3457416 RepID=UPI003FD297DA
MREVVIRRADMDALWQRDVRIHIRRATTVGDLPDTDADQLVYELVGIMLALNHSLQLITTSKHRPAPTERCIGFWKPRTRSQLTVPRCSL